MLKGSQEILQREAEQSSTIEKTPVPGARRMYNRRIDRGIGEACTRMSHRSKKQ